MGSDDTGREEMTKGGSLHSMKSPGANLNHLGFEVIVEGGKEGLTRAETQSKPSRSNVIQLFTNVIYECS
jgi:hypothetical protein